MYRPTDGDRRDEAATHGGHEISVPSIRRDTRLSRPRVRTVERLKEGLLSYFAKPKC